MATMPDLAVLALQLAKDRWGRGWNVFSPREQREKLGAEFLSIVAGWQSTSPDAIEARDTARALLGVTSERVKACASSPARWRSG